MAIFRSLRSLLPAAWLVTLTGCPAAPPPGPALPVVDRNGPVVLQPGREEPDEALRVLARTGVDAATALGPALATFGPLLGALRASRAKHPPGAYRLLQVDGWRFTSGAWIQNAPDGSRLLRAAIEDVDGKVPGWDATREDNYGPDLHPTFPAGAVRLRLDVDQALPSGSRLAAGFAGPLGEAGEAIALTGVGSIVAVGATGALSIEALNARLDAGGTVERGDLGLKGLGTGATLQFTGTWSQAGLLTATLLKSAAPAGTLVQAGGRWEIKNEVGSYPL